jgi:hypothetical protein
MLSALQSLGFAVPYGIAQLHLSMHGRRGRTATSGKIRNRARGRGSDPAAFRTGWGGIPAR